MDDVILAANTISDLHLLATLTEDYCAQYRVKLVSSKTKLLAYSRADNKPLIDHAKLINPIHIGGVPVKFSTEAEHVGIIRNVSGNMPNLLNRISAHKGVLNKILSAGLGRSHRGNPAASLRVHSMYCTPVLFSGLGSLVLTNAETKIIDAHFMNTLRDLQRLHEKTPKSVIFYLAGSLPGEAILHARQLTLYSMICHLPGDPLHAHARHALSYLPNSARSWFHQVRDICLRYSLPHPLCLLDNPLTKSSFKSLIKKNMLEYWEQVLMSEANELKSLNFFHTSQLSLSQPSPVWLASKGSSFECTKSTIVCKMISGRYRSEDLCKYWSSTNRLGYCLASTCEEVVGDLVHILVTCPALAPVRERLRKLWLDKSSQSPGLLQMLKMVLKSAPPVQVQFILDPTIFDGVKMLVELYGMPVLSHIMYLTRTYAYYMHREKLILHGRWPGDFGRKQKKLSAIKTLKTSMLITNNSLVTGPDMTSPSTRTAHSLQVISPVVNASTAQKHYQQPTPYYGSPCTRTQHQPVPGYATTDQSDLYTAGLSCVPLGGSQAACGGAGGGGRGGGDEGSSLDTV